MPADDIVDNQEAGIDEAEIAANFRLPIDQIKAILSYASALDVIKQRPIAISAGERSPFVRHRPARLLDSGGLLIEALSQMK